MFNSSHNLQPNIPPGLVDPQPDRLRERVTGVETDEDVEYRIRYEDARNDLTITRFRDGSFLVTGIAGSLVDKFKGLTDGCVGESAH